MSSTEQARLILNHISQSLGLKQTVCIRLHSESDMTLLFTMRTIFGECTIERNSRHYSLYDGHRVNFFDIEYFVDYLTNSGICDLVYCEYKSGGSGNYDLINVKFNKESRQKFVDALVGWWTVDRKLDTNIHYGTIDIL